MKNMDLLRMWEEGFLISARFISKEVNKTDGTECEIIYEVSHPFGEVPGMKLNDFLCNPVFPCILMDLGVTVDDGKGNRVKKSILDESLISADYVEKEKGVLIFTYKWNREVYTNGEVMNFSAEIKLGNENNSEGKELPLPNKNRKD